MAKRSPVPPGEILLEEHLKPLGISRNRSARGIDLPVSRVSDLRRIRGTTWPEIKGRTRARKAA